MTYEQSLNKGWISVSGDVLYIVVDGIESTLDMADEDSMCLRQLFHVQTPIMHDFCKAYFHDARPFTLEDEKLWLATGEEPYNLVYENWVDNWREPMTLSCLCCAVEYPKPTGEDVDSLRWEYCEDCGITRCDLDINNDLSCPNLLSRKRARLMKLKLEGG